MISQHRFDPASQVVRAAVTAGRLGKITSGLASIALWRSQEYYDSGEWRGTWALDGGGALMNQGVHQIDLLVWMPGRPVAVSATTARLAHEGIEVEDTAVATIRFDGGALAVVHGTTAAHPGISNRVQVQGSQGSRSSTTTGWRTSTPPRTGSAPPTTGPGRAATRRARSCPTAVTRGRRWMPTPASMRTSSAPSRRAASRS